jgi:hypothetical protein
MLLSGESKRFGIYIYGHTYCDGLANNAEIGFSDLQQTARPPAPGLRSI